MKQIIFCLVSADIIMGHGNDASGGLFIFVEDYQYKNAMYVPRV